MIALDRLQLDETAHGQPLLVALAPIDHSKNMLGKNLSCLQQDGLVARLQLLVNPERPLNRGRRNNLLNGVAHDQPLQVAGSGPDTAGATGVPAFTQPTRFIPFIIYRPAIGSLVRRHRRRRRTAKGSRPANSAVFPD